MRFWLDVENTLRKWKKLGDNGRGPIEASDTTPANVGSYIAVARTFGQMRNFVVTESVYIGLAPWDAMAGDIAVVFDCAQTPFVLRKGERIVSAEVAEVSKMEMEHWKEEKCEIVGECYVHGLMENEILDPKFAEKRRTFWIT
jgi:hypothetical protein